MNTAEADWREGCGALGTWFAGGGFTGAFVLVLVRAKVTMPVEFPGLFEAFIKLETAEDGGPRKNEAKRLGFEREVVGGIVVAAVLGFIRGSASRSPHR